MSDDSTIQPSLAGDLIKHYGTGYESRRLTSGASQLELARTQEILRRYLPHPPATILDVGGGPGTYSCWLARLGYQAHLIDILPLHVELALRASQAQPAWPLASARAGDARRLDQPDESVEAVLLLGPLYHLTARSDRVAALAEARRVVRGGGLIFAAAISRFASTLDGLVSGYLDDPEFFRIAESDRRDGQHRNPDNHPAYFTTAFFHLPEELRGEIEEAGLRAEAILGIEGPGWLLQNFDRHWNDAARRERLLIVARSLEAEPSLLGMSAHLLAVARKQV
jgi:SAM-dependent methyltransferase